MWDKAPAGLAECCTSLIFQKRKLNNLTMKRRITGIVPLMVLGALIFFGSCKKAVIDRTTLYPALAPANVDLNADSWKPVLITNPAVFTVAAPDALTSPAYVADINEIKASQSSLSDDQKAIITYWSAGAVLRWN